MPRFSLRTLIVVMAVGGPLLCAALWLASWQFGGPVELALRIIFGPAGR
jgi:hypothetical protein